MCPSSDCEATRLREEEEEEEQEEQEEEEQEEVRGRVPGATPWT